MQLYIMYLQFVETIERPSKISYPFTRTYYESYPTLFWVWALVLAACLFLGYLYSIGNGNITIGWYLFNSRPLPSGDSPSDPTPGDPSHDLESLFESPILLRGYAFRSPILHNEVPGLYSIYILEVDPPNRRIKYVTALTSDSAQTNGSWDWTTYTVSEAAIVLTSVDTRIREPGVDSSGNIYDQVTISTEEDAPRTGRVDFPSDYNNLVAYFSTLEQGHPVTHSA